MNKNKSLFRHAWAEYFEKRNIRFAFFSALKASPGEEQKFRHEKNEKIDELQAKTSNKDPLSGNNDIAYDETEVDVDSDTSYALHLDGDCNDDERLRVLSATELELFFRSNCPIELGSV